MSLPYKDRSGGLICFGILLILLGLLCLLLAAVSGLSMWMAMRNPEAAAVMKPAMVLAAVGVYLALSLLFLWLGIGSLMARRWAAALLHVLSLLWLIGGTGGMAMMINMLVRMREQMEAAGGPGGRGAMVVALIFSAVVMFIGYVLIPGAIWLFYRSPHVTATCAAKDTRERWTDRCPRPVLGAAVGMFLVGLCTANSTMYALAPFFGRLLTGPVAIAVMLGTGLLLLAGSFLIYRLRMAGWWIATVLLFLWTVSSIVTFQLVEPSAWLEAMNMPVQEEAKPFLLASFGKQMGAWVAIGSCAMAAFLLYVKKYLQPPEA